MKFKKEEKKPFCCKFINKIKEIGGHIKVYYGILKFKVKEFFDYIDKKLNKR